MAAPFFYTTQSLLQDLKTLQYPHAEDPKSVSVNGKQRICTLEWLATQIDPTYDISKSNPETLAKFWDARDIHSSQPNANGYRVPFSTSGDRIRDRNAANLFLRSCIDLTMAFKRIRANNPASADWAIQKDENDELQLDEQSDDQDQHSPPLSDYDCQALNQLEILLNNRHKLFPTTLKFTSQTEKKRPFAPRKLPNSNLNNVKRSTSAIPKRKQKNTKDGSDSLKPRHEFQECLRKLEKETSEMNMNDTTDTDKDIILESISDGENEKNELRNRSIKKLGDSMSDLSHVVDNVQSVANVALEDRMKSGNIETRNPQVQKKTTSLVSECNLLHEEVNTMISSLGIATTALQQMEHDSNITRQLGDSNVVQKVINQRTVTETQISR